MTRLKGHSSMYYLWYFYGPECHVPSLTLFESNRVLFQLVLCYLGGLIRDDAQLERIGQRLQIALVHRHV